MVKDAKKVAEEMQAVVEQMRLDDINDNPDVENEFFVCDCCGENKCVAGSIDYNGYRLCNDCVLLAETAFALGKIKDTKELTEYIEDRQLEHLCDFIKKEEQRNKN